ncbi:hypothetical protein MHU86_7814 [Fragilaria crotonensis]|nr:hypothetical protein MHU86_7814 [Fragilaria crotonensis]
MEGQGWPFLQTFNKKRDGRAAFKALKSQAEGKSAIATRKAKAYNMLATATYTGKGKFSFDQLQQIEAFEKAKVKQLREEAKKKEKKDKSDARSVAVVATQEEAPPDDNEGTKTPVVSNAGKQFGRAAHGEQQKQA